MVHYLEAPEALYSKNMGKTSLKTRRAVRNAYTVPLRKATGAAEPDAIKPPRGFIEYLSRAPKSIQKEWADANPSERAALLRRATVPPSAPVKTRRHQRPAIKYLSSTEIANLLRVIKSPRDRAMFELAYRHGLRVSELGMMQMQDYRKGNSLDMDHLYIRRLKGSISGDTILVNAAAVALRAWLRVRGTRDGEIFPSRNHNPISRQQLDRLMKRYCAMANIPREKAHMHALKHTCATLLISDCGESIVAVQKHLGHASISSTAIYSELTDKAKEEMARRLRNWK